MKVSFRFGSWATFLTTLFACHAASAAPRPNWVYLYPGLSWLSAQQTADGQAPATINAFSARVGGIRAGRAFGEWQLEGSAEFEKFSIASRLPGNSATQNYAGYRLGLEALRRVFSNWTALGLTGYARAGFGAFTMPMFDGQNLTELARVDQTTLNLGFSLVTYVAPRARLMLTAKCMPALSTGNSTANRARVGGGFNYTLTGGLQYLFPSQWSAGLLASLQGAKANGILTAIDGSLRPGEISTTMGSFQVNGGYQF